MKASTPELLKFQKLVRRLKDTRRGVIGLLEGMWLATAKNCPQGDIGRFTNEEIAIMLDWDGDPDDLVNALIECRWLDVCSEYRLVVHDWQDHCPTYIKGNLKKAQKEIYSPSCDYQEPPKELPKDGPKEPPKERPMDGPTYPILTYPNQAKPNQASCGEPSQAAPLEFDHRFEFSITGSEEREWYPPVELVQRLKTVFDTVAVEDELRKAALWTFTNASQRKTAKGMPKFLGNWLSKAANGSRGSPSRGGIPDQRQAQADSFLRSLSS